MDPVSNQFTESRYAASLQVANLLLNASGSANSSENADNGNGSDDEETENQSPAGRTALASFLDLGILYSRAKMQGFIDDGDTDTPATETIPNTRKGLNMKYQLKNIAAPLADDFKEAGVPLHEAVERNFDIGFEDSWLSHEVEWLSRLQVRELIPSEEGNEVEKRYW
jgi:hypothetical protein